MFSYPGTCLPKDMTLGIRPFYLSVAIPTGTLGGDSAPGRTGRSQFYWLLVAFALSET